MNTLRHLILWFFLLCVGCSVFARQPESDISTVPLLDILFHPTPQRHNDLTLNDLRNCHRVVVSLWRRVKQKCPVVCSTAPQTDLPPPIVNCTGETATTLRFGWTAVPGAAGYEVNINNTGWIPANGTLSHEVSGVLPGTVLNVLVRGINPDPASGALSGAATCTKCALPVLNTVVVAPDCRGTATGSLTVNVINNTHPPYTFLLGSQSNNTGIFQNLAAGMYTVTATDPSGCSASKTFTLTDPPMLQGSTNAKNTTCFAGSDGSVLALPSGGTAPYKYQWSNNEMTVKITGLVAGTYTVTVTDAKGCTTAFSGTVGQPPSLTALVNTYPVECFGESTGALKLKISNGIPAYKVNWNGPDGYTGLGDSIPQLTAGTYTATITDAVGCTLVYVTGVTQPSSGLMLILPEFADTICFLGKNGIATVTATGGNTPYTYFWDAAAQTTPTASNLESAPYRVTVTDAKGCTQAAETFVLQKQELSVWAATTAPRCYNGTDGTAYPNAAFYGATSADFSLFTYTWSTTPLQTDFTATGLAANTTYTVTISDADGCTATRSVTVGNPYPLIAGAKALTPAPCFGQSGGSAMASGSGGTPPYTYAWNTGNITDSIATNLKAGTYRVTVTDTAGCNLTATATIGEPSEMKVTLLPTDVKCFGESTGSVQAVGSGGASPYSYLWSTGGPVQNAEIKNLPAGSYSISLTDAKGCQVLESITITQPLMALIGTATVRPATCFGARNGQIQLSGGGGTPPHRYTLGTEPWNGSSLQFGLGAGTYTPKIQDKNGCITSLSPVTVSQNPPLLVDLGPDITIALGESTQLITTVSDAILPVHYQWPTADSLWLSCLDCPDPFVDTLLFGRHFRVQVTDSLACSGSDQVFVLVKKIRSVYVPTGFSPNGDGNNDRLVVHGQESARLVNFRVYDRWGELVFQSNNFFLNDSAGGWDGIARGEAAAAGMYVWILEVEYADGARETMQGGATLIR